MTLPPTRVSPPPGEDHKVHWPMNPTPQQKFPSGVGFPKLSIAAAEEAHLLPHGPPLLAHSGTIITEYAPPLAPGHLPWFTLAKDDIYTSNATINTTEVEYEIPVAFYLDHFVSMHYSAFLGECLPRLYALEICRALFGQVKVVVARHQEADFQTHLLNAAGVPSRDIVRFGGMVRCRRLLMATNPLNPEAYASPSSSRFLGVVRDRGAVRDITLPDRIYLSHRGAGNMTNEAEVEEIFARHGFEIIRPGVLPTEKLVPLMANALLIAGPGGAEMCNLAFQGRMRSAFILMPENLVQVSELMFSAGRCCDLRYHIGKSLSPAANDAWTADPARLEAEVADWVRTGS